MGRPRLHDDALRERLLVRADEIVRVSGVHAISVRSLAAAESTSAAAIYALFGSKTELVSALYERAFSNFERSQAAVAVTDDPAADLVELGVAYWNWAMAHPHLYTIMFGEGVAGFVPDPSQDASARRSLGPLFQTLIRCAQNGVITDDIQVIAFSSWALLHGAVSLTLLGHNPGLESERRARIRMQIRAALHGWAPAEPVKAL